MPIKITAGLKKKKIDKLIPDKTILKKNNTVGEIHTSWYQNLLQS